MATRKPKIKIPLFDLKLSAAAKREVADTLNSGWLTTGPKTAALEKSVAAYLKAKYAVAVNSGTAGLQLLLTAIGAGPGREIVTSPFTFVATAEAILATGATAVMADIDPDTLNIDPAAVDRQIGANTLAVMPVDIAGLTAEYESLRKICDRHNLPLIADSAHSINALYRGKSVAKWADAAVLSFYSTKNLTCGEGGMVVSQHKMVIDQVRSLANHGLTSNAFGRKQKGGWKYDALRPGFKANLSDVHAAIGLGQMTQLEKHFRSRQKIAARYLKGLADLTDYLDLPVEPKNSRHGWHLYIIRLVLDRLKCDRDKFIRLMARRGVECGVHYQPLFSLGYYRRHLGMNPASLPHTEYAGRRVVSLPFYPELRNAEVDFVCEAVREIVLRELKKR